MKITLNLSLAPSARDRYALAWAVPATVIGLAGAIFLYRATMGEYREYHSMQKQVAEIQSRADDLHKQEADIRRTFDDPRYQDVLHQSVFINSLISQKKLSMTQLSSRIAGLLPEDAHLTGLTLISPRKPGDDYGVRMGITSKGEDPIETFINDLEDSPDFKDVAIISQNQEESAQGQQVNLICTARYLPGVDVDAETEKPNAKESTPDRKPSH